MGIKYINLWWIINIIKPEKCFKILLLKFHSYKNFKEKINHTPRCPRNTLYLLAISRQLEKCRQLERLHQEINKSTNKRIVLAVCMDTPPPRLYK